MSESSSPSAAPDKEPATLRELSDQYRELKHGMNNSIGVIMAMSELTQLNPNNAQKLINTVLDRGPKIVEQMQVFGAKLAKLAEREG